MKEILIELARLVVMTAIIMVGFFGFIGLIVLMLEGMEVLPQYIGGFFTFLLYVAFYLLIIAVVKHFTDR
jgi:hypothetical protein